jgi:hypothetical protein
VVAFLDADNRWTERHLETMLAALIENRSDLAYCAIEVSDGSVTRRVGADVDYEALRDGPNAIDLNALVVLRSVVDRAGGFDERLKRWVDYDLVLRILKDGTSTYVPTVGVYYDGRQRPDRITVAESVTWRAAVLEPHLIDWERDFQKERRSGISMIVVAQGEVGLTVSSIDALLEDPPAPDVEVVVVIPGGGRSISRQLHLAFATCSAVKLVRLATDFGYAIAANLGVMESSLESIAFVSDGELVGGNLVRDLWRRLTEHGADAACSVGTPPDWGDGRPGFPVMCVVASAAVVKRLRGMDPLMGGSLARADFCLRLETSGSLAIERQDTPVRLADTRSTPAEETLFIERWGRGATLP